MTDEELAEIVRAVRRGRTEDDQVDWKRAFWDLGVGEGQREFLKDITAMANSLSARDRRWVIVGLTKRGAVVNSPLPSDEADLQQRLTSNVTPAPLAP